MKVIGVFIVLSFFSVSFARGLTGLDAAVANEDWKKVYKIVSNKISGTNLPSSKYTEKFEELIAHFKSYDCVVDAEWSKCGAKLAIYPGQETIAIQFKVANKIVEKTFRLMTSKYKTHVRFLGLRIRVPTIDKNEMVCYGMDDSEAGTMIETMRNICVLEVERAKQQKHNQKMFFGLNIIDRKSDGSFPDLHFDCPSNSVQIEFSVTNQTEDTIRLYWPSEQPKSDPLFRINFKTHSPSGLMNEDTAQYYSVYDTIVLKPGEMAKTRQYIQFGNSPSEQIDGHLIHRYNPEELETFKNSASEKGLIYIGFSTVNNGLTWQEDEIWKPAEPIYIFAMNSYKVTEVCD